MLADGVILGCNALGTMPTRQAAFALLEAAVDNGIRHFDTARVYGQGFSERVLGEFFDVAGNDLTVTTKLGPAKYRADLIPTHVALPLNATRRFFRGRWKRPKQSPIGAVDLTRSINRDFVEQSLTASLRWLRRSTIDILLLHEALPSQLTEAARDFLERAKAAGVIGALGVGTRRGILQQFFELDPLCTVLQYDADPLQRPDLLVRFPGHLHIHHSIFKSRNGLSCPQALSMAVSHNPAGKVIFGTTRVKHLHENLQQLA